MVKQNYILFLVIQTYIIILVRSEIINLEISLENCIDISQYNNVQVEETSVIEEFQSSV